MRRDIDRTLWRYQLGDRGNEEVRGVGDVDIGAVHRAMDGKVVGSEELQPGRIRQHHHPRRLLPPGPVHRARRLYDHVAAHTGFIRYELDL